MDRQPLFRLSVAVHRARYVKRACRDIARDHARLPDDHGAGEFQLALDLPIDAQIPRAADLAMNLRVLADDRYYIA